MKLDYSILYKLFCDCFENGLDLLTDANILFENKRYIRAYTLAHLAIEEFSKLPMIHTYMIGIIHNIEFDIPKFLKRMRNHKEKIQMSYFLGDLIDLRKEEVGFENFDELNAYIKETNNLKNNSIYVGIERGCINRPKDFVDRQKAIEIIEEANKQAALHKVFANLSEDEFRLSHCNDAFKELAISKQSRS